MSAKDWFQNGVTFLVIVGLVVKHLAEQKKSFADLLGPLGRRLKDRAERRELIRKEQRTQEFRENIRAGADYKALEGRIEMLSKHIQEMNDEIAKLKREKETDAQDRDMNAAYIGYSMRWANAADLSAAQQDCTLPPRIGYTEFCRKWRKDSRSHR